MNASVLSNQEILAEYRRRFTLGSGQSISDSDTAANHFRGYINDPYREHFIILFLNTNNQIISTEVLNVGGLKSASVSPRSFACSILKHNASAVIIAHNHPSGNLNVSREDKKLTDRLIEVCKLFNVSLHDHLIITSESYYSFRDNGLF